MKQEFPKIRTKLASIIFDSESANYPHGAIIALWHYEPGDSHLPIVLTVTKECGVFIRRYSAQQGTDLIYSGDVENQTRGIIRELISWYEGPLEACSICITENGRSVLFDDGVYAKPGEFTAEQMSKLGNELLSKTEEVIMSPLRFTGVSQEVIKAVFEKYGIPLRPKF